MAKPNASPSVVILGASTRAAAFSARRAGMDPFCADLFADADLSACCPSIRVPATDYPSGLERAAETAPAAPWLYTGALENYPDLVARIARCRPLWGCNADVLRRIRDPFLVAQSLERSGLPHPLVRSTADPLDGHRRWLIKPRDGAGGHGIRERRTAGGTQAQAASPVPGHGLEASRYYYQERLEGLPCAALYVADGRDAVLLGVTQQLVAEPALHARPFHYCGSIGPLSLDHRTRAQCIELGQTLVRDYQLVGLFGVDAILRDGVCWPVEVNPRYTASAEVIEHALGVPLVALHRDACLGALPNSVALTQRQGRPGESAIGKAILFANAPFVVPDLRHWIGQAHSFGGRWPLPIVADIPCEGTSIAPGHPVLSVFALHQSIEACRAALFAQAAAMYDAIGERETA